MTVVNETLFVLENEINVENFIKLDNDLIKEMIPVIGVRMKFLDNFNRYKILNSPVVSLL